MLSRLQQCCRSSFSEFIFKIYISSKVDDCRDGPNVALVQSLPKRRSSVGEGSIGRQAARTAAQI